METTLIYVVDRVNDSFELLRIWEMKKKNEIKWEIYELEDKVDLCLSLSSSLSNINYELEEVAITSNDSKGFQLSQ